MEKAVHFDVLTATALDLQCLLSSGTITSVEVVRAYLTQISAHNHNNGLDLRAMISTVPEPILLDQARRLDAERAADHVRGPLHGIPIILKDNIMTDSIATTCGAYAFAGVKAKRNAPVVQQLVDRGLIVLGKTNMTEWCGLKAKGMMPGYSAVGGQAKSVYIEGWREGDGLVGHWMPGGSSTGSAQGVAAGFSPLSLGTETVGSIVCPANRAALYAMKMTTGSVPTQGIFRLSESFDSLGPMAKSPADLALLAEAVLTEEARDRLPSDGYCGALNASWKDLAIGFVDPDVWNFVNNREEEPDKSVHQQAKAAYEDTITRMRDLGAKIVEHVELPTADQLSYNDKSAFFEIACRQMKENLFQSFIEGMDNPQVHSLPDLIRFNKEHKELALPAPWTDQKDLIAVIENAMTEEEMQAALDKIQKIAGEQGLDAAMDKYGVELIAAPSDCSICSLAAAVGYPVAVIPQGNLDLNDKPFGITVVARAHQERKIFEFMGAFERSFPKRKPPPLLAKQDGEKRQ